MSKVMTIELHFSLYFIGNEQLQHYHHVKPILKCIYKSIAIHIKVDMQNQYRNALILDFKKVLFHNHVHLNSIYNIDDGILCSNIMKFLGYILI